MHKAILNHLVEVKLFLHKKSNKLNILQKLDFISIYEPDQKLSSPPAVERPTTKAISVKKQECTMLLAKNPQYQTQNPDIIYKKAKKA